jgi:hypothetical protein
MGGQLSTHLYTFLQTHGHVSLGKPHPTYDHPHTTDRNRRGAAVLRLYGMTQTRAMIGASGYMQRSSQ